jgi:hypothetical protein
MRVITLLLAPLLVCVAVSASLGGAPDRPIPDRSIIATLAPKGHVLAHPLVTGSIGPFVRASVLITRGPPDDGPSFSGRILVKGKDRKFVWYALPDIDEKADFFATNVRAVMFENVDKVKGREVIILYSAQKIGPGEEVYNAAGVYRWQGNRFVRVTRVEALVAGSANAAAAHRKLTAAKR